MASGIVHDTVRFSLLQGEWEREGIHVVNTFDAKVVSVTSDHTAGDEHVILCDAASGNMTVTLPSAADVTDRMYHIKKTDASANTVTIDGNGSETIDGETTQVITAQYTSITVVSDGTEWWIV